MNVSRSGTSSVGRQGVEGMEMPKSVFVKALGKFVSVQKALELLEELRAEERKLVELTRI